MTSPIELIEVVCPSCGASYATSYRASFNLEIDPEFTDDYDELSSGTCPSCSHRVALGALVVGRDGTWYLPRS